MNLTLSDAKVLAATAQNLARTRVGKPITVVVVDSGGFPILIERMEGARPLTPSIGLAKAYTAAIMQRPCVMLKDWCKAQPEFFAQVSTMGHQPIVATDGGITIKRGGVLLGGLGISGGTGDEDEEICQKTLAECGYELDFGAWNPIHVEGDAEGRR
jgi:uncharacterized protein GlcG (DUF336 family)